MLLVTRGGAAAAVAAEPNEPAHMCLVRQLGAASFTQRELAVKQLLDLGMRVKPALLQGLEQRLHRRLLLLYCLQHASEINGHWTMQDASATAHT